MKANSKEDIVLHWTNTDLDGNVTHTTQLLKNRCVYRRKAGTEYVTGRYNVLRTPDGAGYVERQCKEVRALKFTDIIRKMKETGGSVVILPP